MTQVFDNVKKLTKQLQDAGLPVASVSSSGEIIYSRDLTSKEKKAADSLIAAYDPSDSDQKIERDAYYNAGITLEDMVFALWKKSVLDDPSEVDSLQSLIAEG